MPRQFRCSHGPMVKSQYFWNLRGLWAQHVVSATFRGVHLGRMDQGEVTRSRHLVLSSRNHEYIDLIWKD